MTTCKNCGTEIGEDNRFCPTCGTPVYYSDNPGTPVDPGQHEEKSTHQFGPKKSMIAIIAALVGVVAIAIIISVFSGSQSPDTKVMREALKNNDYEAVQLEYSNSVTDSKKLEKIDKLISEKMDEISEDLDDYDFTTEAQKNEQAFEVWLTRFGTLLTPFEDDVDLPYEPSSFPFNSCISINNQPQWTELCDKMNSKLWYTLAAYGYYHDDYQTAIDNSCGVLPEDTLYNDAENFRNDAANKFLNEAMENVESCLASGDYEAAQEELNFHKEFLSGRVSDEVISSIISKNADLYAKKAEESFNNKKVSTAVSNINLALELDPNNTNYQAQKAKYEEYLPFELYKEDNILKMSSSYSVRYYNMMVANDNSEHEHVIRYSAARIGASEPKSYTYKLGGKYDTVSGTLFVCQEDKNEDIPAFFIIYGDGEKIYTSPEMSAGVLPTEINIDVSGIDTLEIQAFAKNDVNKFYWPDIYISNFVAQKEFK